MTKKSESTSRLQPDERRQLMIEAATRSIIKSGHQGLSVRSVCAEAGVSAGLLTHYFPGKSALITEVYRSLTEEIYTRIDEKIAAPTAANHLDRLRLYIEASFSEPVLNQDFLKVWLVFWSLSQQDPAIATLRDTVSATVIKTLSTLIRRVIKEQQLDPINIRLAAISLSSLMDGLWLEWSLKPETFTPKEAITITNSWVDALVANALISLKQ